MTPRRIFLGWHAPALHLAMERLLETYGDGTVADLSRAVVAVPGARAGRRLKELLLQAADSADLRLAPPRIVTVGALPELIHAPALPAADPVASRRAWAIAARETDPGSLRLVFHTAPDADDVRAWEAIAVDLARLHREVASGGHTFADVARIFRESGGELLFDDHERWEALALVQDRYAAILTAAGRADLDLQRMRAPGAEESRSPDLEIWLLGVVELAAVTRRMLERAGTSIRVLIHAPPEEADAFDHLGCVRPEAWAERSIEYPPDALHLADRPGDQADRALAEIAALGDAYAPEDIAIAVPDRDLVPHLAQRLESHGVPARYAGGTPLALTGTFRLLSAVSEYLRTRGRWEPFSALLRHPDVGAWLARSEVPLPGAGTAFPGLDMDRVLAEADRFHARSLPDRLPASLPTGSLNEARLRLDHALAGLRDVATLTSWPAAILDLLARVHGERMLSRDRPAERRLLDTLSALRAGAVAIARLPGSLDMRCDGATAIDCLLEATRDGSVPDETDSSAVELLGWLEMPLDDAPVAILTGFNEPHLPASINADVFLPDRLRSRLGLLDNQRRYARDACHITALLQDRERVRIIAGRRSAEGDPLHPSRLLLAASGEELARRIRRFARGDAHPAGVMPPRRVPAAASSFRLPPEPDLPVEPPVEIPVTAFRSLLQNPYLHVLKSRYRLRPSDDQARELDGPGFGSLAHEILQEFGNSDGAGMEDEGAIAAVLDGILDRRAGERFGRRGRLPAVSLQLEHLRLRLHAFARWQAGHVAAGWEIAFVEGHPRGAPTRTRGDRRVPFAVDGSAVTLTGRIDRIDHHPASGAWAILDYKSGDRAAGPEETHRAGRGTTRRWVDLQLPLYRHLACGYDESGASLLPAGARDSVRFGYVLLPRTLDRTGADFAGWTGAELDEADEVARGVIRLLRGGRVSYDGDLPASYLEPGVSALLGRRQLVAAVDDDDPGGVLDDGVGEERFA